jgi:glutamate-5-semialdehyde dehydrogenase
MQKTASVLEICSKAKCAAGQLALTSDETRNAALHAMAQGLRKNVDCIIDANQRDIAQAREKGTKEALIDRLALDAGRIEDMALALEALSEMSDPLGQVLEARTLYNGLELTRVSVPLGVVGMIYEARPNVTCDAAGICVKSGNACVLRGGSMAANSNDAISQILSDAVLSVGLPAGTVSWLDSTNRAAADEMMQLHGIVDVIIPRGGAGLISHCVETSKVPVIETGTGNCHVYVHESADLTIAKNIIVNAKCRRYGVCNAAETLLVDKSIAPAFLKEVAPEFEARGVLLHCDAPALEIFRAAGVSEDALALATEIDWQTEYQAPELAVKCVSGLSEAVAHIEKYSTKHSEAIVANDAQVANAFAANVDSACVYVNASTAFSDGGQFGLGAEIGISTQKLHVRGPFALQALTSSKYVVRGSGQVRL